MGEMIPIGKGSWIGSLCSILFGAKIGTGAVVVTNTVVLVAVEAHALFSGAKGTTK